MDVVNEYRWYLCDADFISMQKYPPNHKGCVELTKKRLTLASVLWMHPRMGWNSRSTEDFVHLFAGEQSISKNGLLHILHLFETKQVLTDDKRSIGNVQRHDKRIMAAEYFSADDRTSWEKAIAEGV